LNEENIQVELSTDNLIILALIISEANNTIQNTQNYALCKLITTSDRVFKIGVF